VKPTDFEEFFANPRVHLASCTVPRKFQAIMTPDDSLPAIQPALAELASLLRRRMAVIEDHVWRDRDANSHLDALKQVSEEITAWTSAHRTAVDARLRHYLGNSSFQKALAHIEALTA
jgi:hypothetical protein